MSQYMRFTLRSWLVPSAVLTGILLLSRLAANAQFAKPDNATPEIRNASASPPATSLAANSGLALPGPTSDLLISPDDVLDINVLDVPELSRQYRVAPDGTVALALLPDPLTATGRKVTEFAEAVAGELRARGLINDPHITVSIVASRLKSVSITGSVKKPQIYPVFGTTTLLDVLAQAEGLDQEASNVAVISRGKMGAAASKSGERAQTVDLRKLLESGNPADNVEIYPGDRITVPRAGIVYVVGAVTKPGGFPIKSVGGGMTVLQAIALAENGKPTAVLKKAAIIRVDPAAPDGRNQIPLDLKKILSGKARDPMLQANDILFVPDSEGAKAFRRGMEAVLQTVTGVAIYGRY